VKDFRTFTYCCPTKIYLGMNAHKKLSEIIPGLGVKGLFFLSDSGVASTEIFTLVKTILEEHHVPFDLFTDIEPDPSHKTVEKAYRVYQKNKATALLTLGGGSTIDVGKAVGILATNGGRIHDYEGIDKFSNPPLPIIAIPTTAGTGSEVSGSCVITDTDRGLKMSIRSAALNPTKVAILDPIALRSLPGKVAAHAAMDAFVHALESYISLNANLITDAMNLHAIELISQNVRPFVSNRNNLEAGLKMLCAASLAAMGFSNTGAGNIHCMARFVGAFFHVSHGLSNAVCLPYGAEFNLMANPEKFARVALAMGEMIQGLTALEAGRKAIEAIKQLNRDLGIPERLREVGVTEEKLPEMARLSFEANYNRWNPRYTTVEDFRSLFESAF
jgi:alcohol dehydrogenase